MFEVKWKLKNEMIELLNDFIDLWIYMYRENPEDASLHQRTRLYTGELRPYAEGRVRTLTDTPMFTNGHTRWVYKVNS